MHLADIGYMRVMRQPLTRICLLVARRGVYPRQHHAATECAVNERGGQPRGSDD